MTTDQAKGCAKLLAGLFPNQLTTEQFRNAAQEFRPFEVPAVERAIREHRNGGGTKDGFIDWKNLFEGCRAAAKVDGDNNRNEGTWADVYRRQCPQLANAGDYEVVLRVHRGWWHKCTGRTVSYRRQIESSCVMRLVSAGMDQAKAEEWAATVFEDSVEFFRQCLDEIRDAASRANSAASSILATVYP